MDDQKCQVMVWRFINCILWGYDSSGTIEDSNLDLDGRFLSIQRESFCGHCSLSAPSRGSDRWMIA
jgi:hypothetical protein